MENQKRPNAKLRREIEMKLKTGFLMLLAAIISFSSFSGIMTVNAATINDDGKYTLLLTCGLNGSDGKIDGDYSKMIKFDVADGDTTVSLSELTAGVLPLNGKTQFAYWATDWTGETRVPEDIPLSDFNSKGTFYVEDEEVEYTNGFEIYAAFSEEPLKGTGTYYLTLDGVGGKVNGKYEMTLTSSANDFQTVDLTQYVPVREDFTFVGWALNGEFVTEISADCFKESDAVKVLATFTANAFYDSDIVLTLNANGGTLDGSEAKKYDYTGGRDSGAEMSLLPYVPVREGYTFNGWNTKSDGSGNNYKYLHWRLWDNSEVTNNEFDKDTLIKYDGGYERYKNITLYASWTKASGETVKEIQSTGKTNAKIEFEKGISKDYKLDIKEIEVKKELADKNVKFIADINVLDGNNNVVKISDTKMKVRIALPEDLKGYKKYEVVYILNDEIKETLPAAVENGYIVFETNHLSQYGIVGTNTGNETTEPSDSANPDDENPTNPVNPDNDKPTNPNGDANQNTNSPQTGDNSNLALWFAVLFISCGGVIGVTVYSRRRKLNN